MPPPIAEDYLAGAALATEILAALPELAPGNAVDPARRYFELEPCA